MASGLIHEKIWMDKSKYDDAERQHYESLSKLPKAAKGCAQDTDSTADLSSPKTPVPTTKKTKVPKYVLVAHKTDYTSVLELCEFKEKTSKRSKKTREANRQRDLMNSISNKELPPSPAREEPVGVAPCAVAPVETPVALEAPVVPSAVLPKVVPVAEAPAAPVKQQKSKEPKEKLSKAERKRANKKEREEASKVEEKPAVEEVSVVACESSQGGSSQVCPGSSSLASEVAKARQHIKNSLECMDSVLASVPSAEVVNRISSLETALADLRELVLGLKTQVNTLAQQIPAAQQSRPVIAVCPARPAAASKPAPAPSKDDSDDGVDLFASDSDGEDDAAAAKIREERLANYNAKKSKKPVLIAKSNIILDVKPWDDETDMKMMEVNVRSIECDGLLWGASKLVTLAYGIQKLQISCVVEDDKVSIDWLQEEIEKFEDFVQSVDIAAFNKV